MHCELERFWQAARNQPRFLNFVAEMEKRFSKEVAVVSMNNHPLPKIVGNLLGTVGLDGNFICLFLNIPLVVSRIQVTGLGLDLCLVQVASHELIHFEMDQEGFPITRNLDPLIDPHIGTIIQESILHYEVNRRQAQRGLIFVAPNDPLEVLCQELPKKDYHVARAMLEEIFGSLPEVVMPEDARKAMDRLVSILNLNDKLEVLAANKD